MTLAIVGFVATLVKVTGAPAAPSWSSPRHEVRGDIAKAQPGFLACSIQRRVSRVLDHDTNSWARHQQSGRKFDDQPPQVDVLAGLHTEVDVHVRGEGRKALLREL